jgi:hypothetical protein
MTLRIHAPFASAGAGDWYVLIDGTNVNAVSTVLAAHFAGTAAPAKQVLFGDLQPGVGPRKMRHPAILK